MLDVLTDSVKAEFRAMLSANRPQTFALYAPIRVMLNGRETITGYTISAVGACRLSAFGGDDKERLVGAQSTAQKRYLVALDPGVGLMQSHVIAVHGITPHREGDTAWTKYLQVDAIDAPDRANSVEQKVLTTEILRPAVL